MSIARAVRQIYEKHPYPSLRRSTSARRYWLLPPIPWIEAIWQQQKPVPRILIAGCGTGNEAFAVHTKFPDSEIEAIDFSSRSIRTAKNLQRKNRRFQNIRFRVCDLTNPQLPGLVGDNFDLLSCHGVLSYIPRPRQVLRNFARCLASDGLLYLGLNGEAHPSRRWRQVLPKFGMDVMEFQKTPSLRPLLRLFDVLSDHGAGLIANRNPAYLAGDLFGPLIHDWSLEQWAKHYRAAGFHLWGSYSVFRPLRAAFEGQLYRSLIPRSRAQVVELFEMLKPSSFHRLILSRRPEVRPPWKQLDELGNWRPAFTPLYRWQWPRKTQRWMTIRNLKLKSVSTNTLADLPMAAWQVELLRRSNGKSSINGILRSIPVPTPMRALRDQLYLLYQLCAINLLPPASS
jgi:SAM-dependent methyltransferase